MTNPQVDAGREMDAAIAEEVFGRVVVIAPVGDGLTRTREVWGETMEEASAKLREAYSEHEGLREPYFDGPNYSTLIGAAWEVVEKMNELGFYVTVARTTDGRAFCRLMESNNWVGDGIRAGPATAPLAICRCALKAVRADTEGADG